MTSTIDAFDLAYAVVVGDTDVPDDQPFEPAANVIFGTAFAIASDLFLTAAHVVRAAMSTGTVCVGRFSGQGRFERAIDVECFDDIDIALLRSPGFTPLVLEPAFDSLPIFEEVRAMGFAHGLDPEYQAYVPRGFLGHIVSAHQQFTWPTQPLVYELSFVPPIGMSGAAIVAPGPMRASGIILGSATVQLGGAESRLGVAMHAQELLRLHSRILGGPFATLFNRTPLPPRVRIETALDRGTST